VPTGIWSSQWRSCCAHWDLDCEEEAAGEEAEEAEEAEEEKSSLKSSNPHLAGGEQTPHVRSTFGRSDVVSRGRHKGLWTLSKVSKT